MAADEDVDCTISLWDGDRLRTLKSIEDEAIVKVLAICEGDKMAAAGILGISLKGIYNRLNQMPAV